jgi:hypothetical protein
VIGLAAIVTGLIIRIRDNSTGISFLFPGLFIFLLGFFHRFGVTRNLGFSKQLLFLA